MSAELKEADLVIRIGDWLPYSPQEVEAYRSFVAAGGRLLLLAGFRREPKPDGPSEAFGIRFDKSVLRSRIERWAAHPLTEGLGATEFAAGSVVVECPEQAIRLGWLGQTADPATSGALMMGALDHGKGRIVFLSTVFPMLTVTQPLTNRLFSYLLGKEPEAPPLP